MKLRNLFFVAAAIMLIGTALTACGKSADSADNSKQGSASIIAMGSTALQPLVDEAAKQFTVKNQQVQIQVQGGGSGTGLSQVSAGGADIGNSDIFAEEKQGIDAASLVDHRVAVVGVAPAANPGVGVDNLTKQQLIDIFTGKVTNWKEVGGTDQKIVLVNRPKSSGTRATFFTYALDKNEEHEGITEDSSGTVKKIIGETEGAVGYLAFSYFDDTVKPLSLDGVKPETANVLNNSWYVWAYEHMYTKGEPEGSTKAFLEYMVSDDVQQVLVPQLGYIPVTDMKVERDVNGTVTQK